MKKILIVYAHPVSQSFNASVLKQLEQAFQDSGAEVRIRDLNAIGFNPVLTEQDLAGLRNGRVAPDVQVEQEHIQWADRLVFVYPLWWFDRPAILKGYVDRVFSYGFAYAIGERGAQGLFRHEKAMVVVTTGNPQAGFEQRSQLEGLPVAMRDGTLGFVGIKEVEYVSLYGVLTATPDERRAMLDQVREKALRFAH